MSNKIDHTDMDSILWASMLTILVTLIILATEVKLKIGMLFDLGSEWVFWFVVVFALSILCVIFLAYRTNKKPLNKTWLYLLCLLYLLLLFCCVNASGGLTSSPFVSFYATVLAVGIIISEKPANVFFGIHIGRFSWKSKVPRSLVVLVLLIAFCMLGHLLLQYNNHTGEIAPNQGSQSNEHKPEIPSEPNQKTMPIDTHSQVREQLPVAYLLKYMSVILIALIATGVADYKSLNNTVPNATTPNIEIAPQDDKKTT